MTARTSRSGPTPTASCRNFLVRSSITPEPSQNSRRVYTSPTARRRHGASPRDHFLGPSAAKYDYSFPGVKIPILTPDRLRQSSLPTVLAATQPNIAPQYCVSGNIGTWHVIYLTWSSSSTASAKSCCPDKCRLNSTLGRLVNEQRPLVPTLAKLRRCPKFTSSRSRA